MVVLKGGCKIFPLFKFYHIYSFGYMLLICGRLQFGDGCSGKRFLYSEDKLTPYCPYWKMDFKSLAKCIRGLAEIVLSKLLNKK